MNWAPQLGLEHLPEDTGKILHMSNCRIFQAGQGQAYETRSLHVQVTFSETCAWWLRKSCSHIHGPWVWTRVSKIWKCCDGSSFLKAWSRMQVLSANTAFGQPRRIASTSLTLPACRMECTAKVIADSQVGLRNELQSLAIF